MRNFFIALVFLYSSFALADDTSEMRAVLQANFDACNNEDANALLETCSVDMPDREGFRQESIKLWREKDIYYRLVGIKFLTINDGYAEASVIQTSHTKDRESSSKREEFIRNGTTLLTKSECVRYNVAFKKDNGVWKCYMTISEPIECDLNGRPLVPAQAR
jgi:hypothetical protein